MTQKDTMWHKFLTLWLFNTLVDLIMINLLVSLCPLCPKSSLETSIKPYIGLKFGVIVSFFKSGQSPDVWHLQGLFQASKPVGSALTSLINEPGLSQSSANHYPTADTNFICNYKDHKKIQLGFKIYTYYNINNSTREFCYLQLAIVDCIIFVVHRTLKQLKSKITQKESSPCNSTW